MTIWFGYGRYGKVTEMLRMSYGRYGRVTDVTDGLQTITDGLRTLRMVTDVTEGYGRYGRLRTVTDDYGH